MKYTFHRTKDHIHFKYGIQVLTMIDFHNTRRWLVESYGYGVDIDKLESCDKSFIIIHDDHISYEIFFDR